MSSLDNYEIIPAVKSEIRHRSECVPYYDAFFSTDCDDWCLAGAYLPIFVAPMSSVIDDKNYLKFDEFGLNPIIPRTISLTRRLEIAKQMIWVALGLDEFKAFVATHGYLEQETYICVDVANGHMQDLIDTCAKAKDKLGENLILMTGNIANPDTYYEYAKAGIDYVRCSIGTGSVCSTSYLSGIHYSADKLIKALVNKKFYVNENRSNYKSAPKIVMDGGIDSIRQIIIALAMGADYVMCGRIFASAEEACGKIITIDDKPYREYYGMSTERAQKEMGNKKIKSSEGVSKVVPIKYTLKEWTDKFVAVISSTMSYCNTRMLSDFIGKVYVQEASKGEYEGYEKSKFM